jgi:hypothetical protein
MISASLYLETFMPEATYVNEIDAITTDLQAYMEGARTGRSETMKPSFHDHATIYGYVGPDLFGGPIQGFFDWNDQNGPASEVQFRLSSIDIVGSSASVRVDIDDWTGHRFTDFFNMVKFDGDWKVVSKIFYIHP